MKKVLILIVSVSLVATSCVSKKKYSDLQTEQASIQSKLASAQKNLSASTVDLGKAENEISALKDRIQFLEKGNSKYLENVDNLIAMSKSATENMRQTLSQLQQKDEYIKYIREANSKKDSINLAVAFNLKKILPGGLNDEDISVNIEGTKVFISIADKLLFNSGSYRISKRAESILKKVGAVVNEYPNMDVMVEGHTDDKLVKEGASVKDNWDLSVQRSAAVVRELQTKYDVLPARLIAAGRSQYAPVVENSSAENRSKNRRTKIIIMPKLDEFFELLDGEK
ncbi:OmpA family protein [Wenyingzhuangia sp. 2_MG-2023]|uniref:OmpA family protein n=1 Tax=Wenyingzhuangia sp. 2_MG-2023 TaxID=3062639 RepID=UPI0026E31DD4|nr:OmpA family protein [Wenyingzhuangia sp. 2_MG-2023]MDO6736443.1 OmpA family protein [Wenyingzhuangia sp. 2_MG-2023]MDO6801245.1 OmpA family protein [Wenyingzhuangia sp. 1_MG-2023]